MFDLIEKIDEMKARREKLKEENGGQISTSFVPDLKNYDMYTMKKILDLEIERRELELRIIKINEELFKLGKQKRLVGK